MIAFPAIRSPSAAGHRPVAASDGRIRAATLDCIGRWGVSKTTLDDVARQARCSRATVYRMFPGGKDALVQAVARAEVDRVAAAVSARMEAAATLEEVLAAGLAEAARQLTGHPVLVFLLAHEPDMVVPWLAFQRGNQLLRFATALAAPQLARFLDPDGARRAAEWATRVLLAFSLCPAAGVDLTDDAAARRIVTMFLLPGLVRDGEESHHDH